MPWTTIGITAPLKGNAIHRKYVHVPPVVVTDVVVVKAVAVVVSPVSSGTSGTTQPFVVISFIVLSPHRHINAQQNLSEGSR